MAGVVDFSPVLPEIVAFFDEHTIPPLQAENFPPVVFVIEEVSLVLSHGSSWLVFTSEESTDWYENHNPNQDDKSRDDSGEPLKTKCQDV